MITRFIVTCPCGQKNRALIGKRSRCGRCKREFTKDELARAAMSASIFDSLGSDIDTVEWRDDNGTLHHKIERDK